MDVQDETLLYIFLCFCSFRQCHMQGLIIIWYLMEMPSMPLVDILLHQKLMQWRDIPKILDGRQWQHCRTTIIGLYDTWHIEWEQISRELIMFAGKSRSGKKNWTQQFFILISMKTFPIISVHLFLLDTVQYLMNWMITSIWLEEEIMLIRHINIKYQQIHGGQCMIHLLTTVFM